VATEYKKNVAHQRGVNGKMGARSGWYLKFADAEERAAYEEGLRVRAEIQEQEVQDKSRLDAEEASNTRLQEYRKSKTK
jgi:hypothetical protein